MKPDSSNSEPGNSLLALTPAQSASGWGTAGQCSVPLIEVPISESLDQPMVRKMPAHPDDKMSIAPPPVCPLRGALGKRPKLK